MARTPPARTAGQRPLIAVVATAVLALAGFAVVDAGTSQGGPGGATAASPAPPPEPGRTAEVVGPPRGTDVQAYIDDRTEELLAAPDGVDTAVVSFTEKLRIEDALTLVAGAGEVRAVLVRLPLEGERPETIRVGPEEDPVPAVRALVDGLAEQLRDERAELEELLGSGTVDDPDFEADYERRIGEIDGTLAELAGDAALVHAVVLRGPLGGLRELSGATAIRLVDPAPPGTDIGLSMFHGLLPGDTGTVSFGASP